MSEPDEHEYREYAERKIRELKTQLSAYKDVVPLPDEGVVDWFCKHNGAQEVHRSWCDNMLAQDRWVDAVRIKWDTLPDVDKLLDEKIAKDVIMDFVVWLKSRDALSKLPEVTDGK